MRFVTWNVSWEANSGADISNSKLKDFFQVCTGENAGECREATKGTIETMIKTFEPDIVALQEIPLEFFSDDNKQVTISDGIKYWFGSLCEAYNVYNHKTKDEHIVTLVKEGLTVTECAGGCFTEGYAWLLTRTETCTVVNVHMNHGWRKENATHFPCPWSDDHTVTTPVYVLGDFNDNLDSLPQDGPYRLFTRNNSSSIDNVTVLRPADQDLMGLQFTLKDFYLHNSDHEPVFAVDSVDCDKPLQMTLRYNDDDQTDDDCAEEIIVKYTNNELCVTVTIKHPSTLLPLLKFVRWYHNVVNLTYDTNENLTDAATACFAYLGVKRVNDASRNSEFQCFNINQPDIRNACSSHTLRYDSKNYHVFRGEIGQYPNESPGRPRWFGSVHAAYMYYFRDNRDNKFMFYQELPVGRYAPLDFFAYSKAKDIMSKTDNLSPLESFGLCCLFYATGFCTVGFANAFVEYCNSCVPNTLQKNFCKEGGLDDVCGNRTSHTLTDTYAVAYIQNCKDFAGFNGYINGTTTMHPEVCLFKHSRANYETCKVQNILQGGTQYLNTPTGQSIRRYDSDYTEASSGVCSKTPDQTSINTHMFDKLKSKFNEDQVKHLLQSTGIAFEAYSGVNGGRYCGKRQRPQEPHVQDKLQKFGDPPPLPPPDAYNPHTMNGDILAGVAYKKYVECSAGVATRGGSSKLPLAAALGALTVITSAFPR